MLRAPASAFGCQTKTRGAEHANSASTGAITHLPLPARLCTSSLHAQRRARTVTSATVSRRGQLNQQIKEMRASMAEDEQLAVSVERVGGLVPVGVCRVGVPEKL